MSDFHPIRLNFKDPVFGELPYFNKNQFNPNLPKIDKICSRPFTAIEIAAMGEVIVCCFDWLPVKLGNVLSNTLDEIWQGPKAETLRNTILDGSYKYCNRETCHSLVSPEKKDLKSKDVFKQPTQKLPEIILFSVDPTCNLYCPSCRKEELKQLDANRHTRAMTIVKSVLKQIVAEPHDQKIMIGFDGTGEVFHSAIYREIFETENFFSNLELWPNITFLFKTNGVMMTEKIQKRYAHLFKRMESISISIDAGNKESYDKVRLGGQWDLLWKNLDYLHETCFNPDSLDSQDWSWQLILQEDNYESIPELIKLARSYTKKMPSVVISPLINWGTFTSEEFAKKAVWQPTSEKYQHLLEILNSPEVRDYPRLVSPISK